ncbi:MAG: cysteine desulfurase-like protein [Acidimicrobiales bacterium]
MGYDVAAIRSMFPALADGCAYLDGAAGTQVPTSVIQAIAEAYRKGLGNLGGTFPASARSEEIVAEARRAVADLVGGEASGVVLGPNMTTLTYRMSQALSKQWSPGDEIVVSRLDHDANVRPWVQAAQRAGAGVKWAEVDVATGELPAGQYDELIGARTKLVAVTAASNAIGTRPDVAAITSKAHAAGALAYVDGVHATPHGPVDVASLGADFYVTSAYKWAGPHVGALVADPALLEDVHPDKLAPSGDEVPERFEWGTSAFADLAGVVAAVDHLAGLDSAAAGSRRQRLRASMAASERHELELFALLLAGLDDLGVVTTYGRAKQRAATAYFNVAGQAPRAVAEHLASRGVNVWSGDNYAFELTTAMGIRDSGGAVRAGIVHYNDQSDVQRLLDGVAELV